MILAIACYCLFNDNRNGDDSLDFVPIHTRCPNSPPSTVQPKRCKLHRMLLWLALSVNIRMCQLCVHVVCSGMMTTSLLQVANSLDRRQLSRLFSTSLMFKQLPTSQKISSCIFTDLMQRNEGNSLDAT